MANLTYSSDILNYMLFKAGEKTDGTSDYDSVALEYLNTAYRKLWQGGSEFDPTVNEDWTWLRAKGNLILQTKISTGTVSVTNNSATATLSATQSTDLDNWYFKTDAHEAIFRISAHTGGSDTLTLDSVYTGDTDASAGYKLVKLDYTLASDAIEVLSPMTTSFQSGSLRPGGRIDGISEQSLPFQNQLYAGVPYFFSQIDETTVRFNRYADTDLIRVDYRYRKRPADLTDSGSEEPLIPLRHRHVLANIALFDLLMDLNDDRADAVGLIAKQGLKAMSIENKKKIAQMDENFGKIFPIQPNYYNRVYVGEPYS